MNLPLSIHQASKWQRKLSALTILVFCMAFFAHSDHLTQVELDSSLNFNLHDCNLCQQGIDSPPENNKLSPKIDAIYSHVSTYLYSANFIVAIYVIPQLRAPPTSL